MSNNATLQTRTTSVKCSMSSITTPLARNAFNDDLILYMNQVRVQCTLLIKQHICTILNSNPLGLPFSFDQNYVSACMTMIRLGKITQKQRPFEAGLQDAYNQLAAFGFNKPIYRGCLKSATIMCQIGSCFSMMIVTNTKTHVQEHIYHALENWLNNQIRAKLNDSQYENKQRKHISTYKRNLQALDPQLHQLYQAKRAELKELKFKDITTQRLVFMWRLHKDIEELQLTTGRQMKHFSVIPEAKIRLTSLTLDQTVMSYMSADLFPDLRGQGAKLKKTKSEEPWTRLFNMDAISKLRRNGWTFAHYITTNGITAQILFKKQIELTHCDDISKTKKAKTLHPLTPGLYIEGETENVLPSHNIVAVDPGIRDIFSMVSISDPTIKPLQLSQGQYRCESGLNWRIDTYKSMLTPVLAEIHKAMPAGKTVVPESIATYLSYLAQHWTTLWDFWRRRRIRRADFYVFKKRKSFMDGLSNTVAKRFGANPIILWGEASSKKYGFGKVKGGGVKGPVKEICQRLAKRFAVIQVSEFRTSKCCIKCGGLMSHPQNKQTKQLIQGVSFCNNQFHDFHVVNRDTDAAYKIGARFLAKQGGNDLGTFDTQIKDVLKWMQEQSGSVFTVNTLWQTMEVFRENHDIHLYI